MRGVAKLSLARVAPATKRAQGPCEEREQTECSEDDRAVVAQKVFSYARPRRYGRERSATPIIKRSLRVC
jgi:hypothetical protein